MTNITRNNALQFLKCVTYDELDDIHQDPFFNDLRNNPQFEKEIKTVIKNEPSKEDDRLFILNVATAIAKALVSFNDFSDVTFNAATKRSLKPHIAAIEDALSTSMAFPCEFEQSMFLSQLEELKSATTPTRGHKTKGGTKKFRQRKMLKELTLSIQDSGIETTPAVITNFASIIDESVEYKTVVSQLSSKSPEETREWRTYSETFLNQVYKPYCQFRSTFKDK